ncbi:DNA alkylation repair protein [Riemerella anatipestifer]|uniref:DNA alkylation repair protein n=1 Tax=Riemerella anatipestifer TaxID=34085 RepID=A0AAP6HEK6_RIEAN|nr:DNA alkylation repair protein [Riemerella anatipestifer]MBT0548880.1 DNA alkylation repair protein [Riemerella anatipestifer]MBT0555194.1 DNA alkylation repair protein [Riemerella anatipestifer]MBT0559643.1 DNA alkylation repair protein [Riemerella anatipestifer]MCD5968062.1 DNA alkylation repair protein [Riemerella anatipestifer]MCO7354782.1 DNA alkylation repair protein [Riemerella anatipestifer]
MILLEIKQALKDLSDEQRATFSLKYFKANKGEYAEGDQFIGVTVPDQRQVAKAFWQTVSLEEIKQLLQSEIHEHRLTALLMLVLKFEKIPLKRKELVDFYLSNLEGVNNWDLVDTSAYKLLGRYCFDNDAESLLDSLANSKNLWHNRIAVVSMLYYIRKEQYTLPQKLILKHLNHPHDLIHKANGWMLRELGKRNEEILLEFLKQHYTAMPRTTLRYAIEKLDEPLRQDFLNGKI